MRATSGGRTPSIRLAAPSVRGRKHLVELAQCRRGGDRAVIFFALQRSDAATVGPADAKDPEYGVELRRALAAGVEAMAASGTVAVLLPGAFYFLRETQLPPMDALRDNNVPIAIATDLNPGSSPAQSILTMMNMAATLFQMTPEEALAGVTIHAASALGIQAEAGTLEIGKAADFVIWDITEPAELTYWIGNGQPVQTIFGGAVRP